MNFAEYFESTVERCPDKTAVVFQGSCLSYAELHGRVRRAASALVSLGLRPGDTAAIVAGNVPAYLEVLLACARTGVVLEQYNWRLSPERIGELFGESGSRVLFCSSSCVDAGRRVLDRSARPCAAIALDGPRREGWLSYEELLASADGDAGIVPLNDAAPLMHLFTSGTTGKPKTVRLSHKGVVSVALVCIAETLWTEDDVFLQVLPLFHISAQAAYNVLMLGGTLVLLDRFDPEDYLRHLIEQRVTRIGLVPSMLGALLQFPGFSAEGCPSLRTVVYAGSPMPRPVLDRCAQRLVCDLYAFYGMTEMSSVVGILKPADHARILAHGEGAPVPVGKPSVGTRLALVDERGRPVPCGREGELVARSDGMMLGYSDPALTRRAVRDGWYRTGDVCRRDAEGYYYLVGRKGDMIISGGENLYPSEVEECIRRMGPDVVDVTVVGLPDDAWGQIVAAAVVRRPGSALEEGAVQAWCREQLASYKKPRRVAFWDDLPRNANGKVSRSQVAERMTAAVERDGAV